MGLKAFLASSQCCWTKTNKVQSWRMLKFHCNHIWHHYIFTKCDQITLLHFFLSQEGCKAVKYRGEMFTLKLNIFSFVHSLTAPPYVFGMHFQLRPAKYSSWNSPSQQLHRTQTSFKSNSNNLSGFWWCPTEQKQASRIQPSQWASFSEEIMEHEEFYPTSCYWTEYKGCVLQQCKRDSLMDITKQI